MHVPDAAKFARAGYFQCGFGESQRASTHGNGKQGLYAET